MGSEGHPTSPFGISCTPAFKARLVVLMRYYADEPVDRVADILGMPPGSVKRELHDLSKKRA